MGGVGSPLNNVFQFLPRAIASIEIIGQLQRSDKGYASPEKKATRAPTAGTLPGSLGHLLALRVTPPVALFVASMARRLRLDLLKPSRSRFVIEIEGSLAVGVAAEATVGLALRKLIAGLLVRSLVGESRHPVMR